MRLKLAILVFALILAVGLFFVWLLNSESGLQWAYQQTRFLMPQSVSIEDLSGNLGDKVFARKIRYQNNNQSIEANAVELSLNPLGLFRNQLTFSDLKVDSVKAVLTPPKISSDQSIALPAINLPIPIKINNARIERVELTQGLNSLTLGQVQFSGGMQGSGLTIVELQLNHDLGNATLRGELEANDTYQHDFEIAWQAKLGQQLNLNGNGTLRGDLQSSRLQQTTRGTSEIDLALQIERPLADIEWQAVLKIASLDQRLVDHFFSGPMPVTLGNAEIDANGDADSADASGQLSAESAELGQFEADFEVSSLELSRRFGGLKLNTVEISADSGRLTASGEVSWKPNLIWDLELSTEQLDPALVWPEWPGKINAVAQSRGEVIHEDVKTRLDIASVSGELRGYPISGSSQLQWRNGRVSVDQLDLKSASSKLSAVGSIDPGLKLNWSIQSDHLAELYPGLLGSLNAEGQLSGSVDQPVVDAVFNGSRLQFADHKIGHAQGELTYYLKTIERSNINLSLQAIQFQNIHLKSVNLDASPSSIELELEAEAVDAELALNGKLDGNKWQGEWVKANVRTRHHQNWSLETPSQIVIEPKQIRLETLCLQSDQQAKLCHRLRRNQDLWNLEFDLRESPLAWFDPWLPDNLEFDGLAHSSIDLQYQPSKPLSGSIDLELMPGVATYRLSDTSSERLLYQTGELKLGLDDAGASALIVIELNDGDLIEGQVTLPNADWLKLDSSTQPIVGEFQMILSQLGMIGDRLEKIDDLKGQLAIDLAVSGTLEQPKLQGDAQLSNGQFNIPAMGLELTQLEVTANSQGDDIFRFNGEAKIANGTLNFDGATNLNASQNWSTSLQLGMIGLDIEQLLGPWLPLDSGVSGNLYGEANLNLQTPDELYGVVSLTTADGKLSHPLLDGEIKTWEIRNSGLNITLNEQGISGESRLLIGNDNAFEGNFTMPKARLLSTDWQRQAFDANSKLNFTELAIIETLFPDISQLSGSIALNLKATGTLNKPSLKLTAETTQASANIPRLGLRLDQINLRGETSADNQFTFNLEVLSGASFLAVNGSSQLDAAAGWPTRMLVTSEAFEIVKIPEANIKLTSELVIQTKGKLIDLRGDIKVPYAKLRPNDLSTAAKVSNDTVIIGGDIAASEPWQITSRINLSLGDEVNFYGFGFDGKLGGNLLIEEEIGQLARGTGEINVPQGRYQAYGQNLEVQNGRLLFTGGPIANPGLDLRAVRQVDGITVGIQVGGRLRQPQLALFSIPAMGETNALSYLILGRSMESASGKDGQMMAQAALALGLSGGDFLARKIGDQFGLDEMRIASSDSGDKASLVVGRYLSPKIYLSYGIALFGAFNTLNLRYGISENWQLKVESGENHATDLIYSIER